MNKPNAAAYWSGQGAKVIICSLSYALPIYGFALLFRQQLPDLTGMYLDSAFGFTLLGTVLSVIFLWLSPTYFYKLGYKISVILIYIALYSQACIGTALDHSVAFGTTWSNLEVLSALVLPHWYFYLLGIFGVVSHYLAQRALATPKLNYRMNE